jgi:hypothetical protein
MGQAFGKYRVPINRRGRQGTFCRRAFSKLLRNRATSGGYGSTEETNEMSDFQFNNDTNVSDRKAVERDSHGYLVRGATAFAMVAVLFLAWAVYSLGQLVMTLGPNASGWALLGTVAPLIVGAGMLFLAFYGLSQMKTYRELQVQGDRSSSSEPVVRWDETRSAEPAPHRETADAA